jgi:regulation of enolase protein 1 (concanavalin A-like superfamily)
MDTYFRLPPIRRSLAALIAVLVMAALGPAPTAANAAVGAPPVFDDVASSSPHAEAIQRLASAQITLGCAPKRYCPSAGISRAQMATLLARTLGIQPVQRGPFRDVAATSPHAGSINALAARDVLNGCAPGSFCPGRSVSRAQMASAIARAFDLEPTGEHPGFRDVRGGVHAPSIQALADAGITHGCGGDRFCGNDPVTRGQFASLLVRTADDLITAASTASNGKGNGRDNGNKGGKGGNGGTTGPSDPEPVPPIEEPAPSDPEPVPPIEEPVPSDPEPVPPIEEPVSPVPDPAPVGDFTRTSIGAPTPAGSLTHDADIYRLTGAGADIWNTTDSFEFAHRSQTGDTSMVVRVSDQTRTHAWAKAGVMVRTDDSPGSAHVSVFKTPDHGVSLQYRPSQGDQTLAITSGTAAASTWLRLDRVGNTFTAYSSEDGTNWRVVGSVTVAVGATALIGLAVTSHADGTLSGARFSDLRTGPVPSSPTAPDPDTDTVPAGASTFLYSSADVARFRTMMAGGGPYFRTGDAGHGGIYSPGDGARAVTMANDFLANPQASYWIQPNLPLASGDAWPNNIRYARPMHAAWVYMTQPDNPNREAYRREVKALLLHHANHPSHDYANSTNYPVNYPGFAPSPIFGTAHWMTRLIKARDMLGRESFTGAENAALDRWFYDYANWSFKWMHHESYGKQIPGRESRDYTRVNISPNAHRKSYDGGPLIGSMAMAYNNRMAAVASTASLAANYLKANNYAGPSSTAPAYGRFSVDQLLHHSRLFVEETLRFSVHPHGFQGDFERGDRVEHTSSTPQLGWLYSSNVLANLVEMAEYHAKRGDLSVWNYGTTAGYDGTAGVPVAGGFTQKNLHFYAWSMSRYVNNGWGRTNNGQPLASPHFYHDVIPAATAARFAPTDPLLNAAWRRSGSGFPAYPQAPATQGIWHGQLGEGAKYIGLIEQAGASRLGSS